MSAAPPESTLVKLSLLKDMPIPCPDRARAAGAAAVTHTVGARRGGDVGDAGGHIKTSRGEGADRAGRQARLVETAVARPRPAIRRRQV